MTLKNLVSATAFALVAYVSSAALAQQGTVPQQICDPGAFVAGSDVYSFEDVIIEGDDAMKLNDSGTVAAYGYLVAIRIADDEIEAKLTTVEECYPDTFFNVTVKSNQLIDMVITKGGLSGDEWKDVRRTILKVDNGFTAKALVALTGSFAPKANDGIFFLASSIVIVDSYVEL